MAKKKSRTVRKTGFVWRVENDYGRGMYYGSGGFYVVSGNHQTDRQPSPERDEQLRNAMLKRLRHSDFRGYHFGFATLKQFKAWVHDAHWRRALHANGFKLVKYKSDLYFHGSSQAVFDKARSTVVETRPVDYAD